MNDRELLEMAAKAAGIWVDDDNFSDPIDRKYTPNLGLWVHVGDSKDIGHWWNPLNNGDHALRLAVKLRLCIDNCVGEDEDRTDVSVGNEIGCAGSVIVDELRGIDADAATRRAIVRAAAEIGRAMP